MKKTNLNVLLGFDFGTKSIGVAVGQTITQTARGVTAVKVIKGKIHWETIDALIKTWKPDALVVGIPLNMDGTEQPLTVLANQFAQLLHERYQLPVYNADERLTTVAAKDELFNQGGYRALNKSDIDSKSAQLILQSWLKQEADDKP